jgi:hypothetical protein
VREGRNSSNIILDFFLNKPFRIYLSTNVYGAEGNYPDNSDEPLPIEPLTYGYLQATDCPMFRSGARCDAWLRYDPI